MLLERIAHTDAIRIFYCMSTTPHIGESESTLRELSPGEHVGDFVFGGIDGVVTTFAVVAGVAGADLSASIVLVLGLSNLLADGFAMAVGNFLSIRSEHERYARERTQELYEIEHMPEHERKEVEDIYRAKGFSGDTLTHIVETITADKDRWLNTMLQDELGLARDNRSPIKGGLITYGAFIIIGFIPLLSFVAAIFLNPLRPYTFTISVVLTAVALFTIGALKTLVVDRPFWRSGMETLFMGGLAAIVAYVVGYLLKDFSL